MLIKYGPPARLDSFEGRLPLAAASPFSAIRVLCMGLKPVKYSTHAQLPPFVCCTYAVRLIVAPPKNNSFNVV